MADAGTSVGALDLTGAGDGRQAGTDETLRGPARLGTSVLLDARGTASGIINTAAQLGTALGIAALLLVATLSSGIPEQGSPVPAVAWGIAALISGTGAIIFGLSSAGRRPTS